MNILFGIIIIYIIFLIIVINENIIYIILLFIIIYYIIVEKNVVQIFGGVFNDTIKNICNCIKSNDCGKYNHLTDEQRKKYVDIFCGENPKSIDIVENSNASLAYGEFDDKESLYGNF